MKTKTPESILMNSDRRRPDSYREIIAVSFPIIAGMAGRTIMMFCDRLFLARHSQLELQAALPAGILSFTLLCIFYGTAGYSSTFVAQYFGADDRDGCSKAFAQGLFLTMFCAPFLALMAIPGSFLLDLSRHAPEVLALEKTYFRILMFSGAGPVFTVAAAAFWNGRGKTVPAMLAVLAGAGLNILLDYLMIFGKMGFPEMGIKGAAIATAISSFVPGTILTVAAFSGRTARWYRTRENFKFSRELTGRIIRFGFPAGLQIFMDVGSFTVFIFIAGRLGALDFTANNLAFSVNNLAFNPLLGFSFATTVIVDTRLFFSPDSACTIEELSATTAKLLAIVAAWGVFDAMSLMFSGALRGAGDTKFVVWVSSLFAWLFWIPGVLYLYSVRNVGIVPLWAFTSVYVAILSVIFLFRFRSGKWKNIDLLGRF
jgi:MATE family multidrug resistance protein